MLANITVALCSRALGSLPGGPGAYSAPSVCDQAPVRGGSQGQCPSTHPSARHLSSATLVSILRCVSFLFYCASLPSFSFLPYPGGGRQSLGRPDAVSLESTGEGTWNCFTVAGQTMESSRRLGLLHFERHARGSGQAAADFIFGVAKDGNPPPRNLATRGTFGPAPTGSTGSHRPPVPRGLRVMKRTDHQETENMTECAGQSPAPPKQPAAWVSGSPPPSSRGLNLLSSVPGAWRGRTLADCPQGGLKSSPGRNVLPSKYGHTPAAPKQSRPVGTECPPCWDPRSKRRRPSPPGPLLLRCGSSSAPAGLQLGPRQHGFLSPDTLSTYSSPSCWSPSRLSPLWTWGHPVT